MNTRNNEDIRIQFLSLKSVILNKEKTALGRYSSATILLGTRDNDSTREGIAN